MMPTMTNTSARRIIADTLMDNSQADPGLPNKILAALGDAGYHLLSTPVTTQDVPEEVVAAQIDRQTARFEGPHEVRYTLTAALDDEILSYSWVELIHHILLDEGYRKHMRQKVGIEFLAAMWRRLDPESPVEQQQESGEADG